MAVSDFVSAIHVAVLGRPVDFTSLANTAAIVSTEGRTVTAPFYQAKSGEVPGGPSPQALDYFVPITPQTIAGGGPELGYGLLNNGTLTADQSEAVLAEISRGTAATGLDSSVDVMQAQAIQVDSFTNLGFFGSSTVTAGLGGGAAMLLAGMPDASLHAVTFRLA